MISFFSLISPLVYYCNAHFLEIQFDIHGFFPLLKCLDVYFEKTIMPRSNSSVKYILIKLFEWSSESRIVSWFEWFQSYWVWYSIMPSAFAKPTECLTLLYIWGTSSILYLWTHFCIQDMYLLFYFSLFSLLKNTHQQLQCQTQCVQLSSWWILRWMVTHHHSH